MDAPTEPTAKVRDAQGYELDASIPIELGTISEPDGRVTGGGEATLGEVCQAHDLARARKRDHERRRAIQAPRPAAPVDSRASGRSRERRDQPGTRRRAPRGDPDDPDPPRPPRARGPRHVSHALTRAGFDPFDRPLDRLLAGLRRHSLDAYRLMSGKHGQPDRWIARCPLHPDAGFSLAVSDRGDDREPGLWCRVGCPEGIVRYALVDDPERERAAKAAARVLLWAESWKRSA